MGVENWATTLNKTQLSELLNEIEKHVQEHEDCIDISQWIRDVGIKRGFSKHGIERMIKEYDDLVKHYSAIHDIFEARLLEGAIGNKTKTIFNMFKLKSSHGYIEEGKQSAAKKGTLFGKESLNSAWKKSPK